MALYDLAVRTVATASGSAAAEIIGGTTQRSRIFEIGVSLAAATASTWGIGRPAAAGVTPTSPVVFLAEDPADNAPGAKIATAWGTAPTVPAAFFRRFSAPATIGTAIIWTFPQGIALASGATFVLWNAALNGVVDLYAVIGE